MATDLPDWSAPGRPAFYDRNPLRVNQNSSNFGIGPHGNTQRWAYTVPAGRLFQVTLLFLQIVRVTAAAPASESWAQIAGAGSPIDLEDYAAAVNDGHLVGVGNAQIMGPGNEINCSTGDVSTGGTKTYTTGMQGTEFDI